MKDEAHESVFKASARHDGEGCNEIAFLGSDIDGASLEHLSLYVSKQDERPFQPLDKSIKPRP